MVTWLEKNGDADNDFTPGEVVAIKGDLARLKDQGTKFINDPRKTYEEAHKHRG